MWQGPVAFYEGRHFAAPDGQADLGLPLYADVEESQVVGSAVWRHSGPGQPLHNDAYGRRTVGLEQEP